MNLSKTEPPKKAPKKKMSQEDKAGILLISGVLLIFIVCEWALWVITHWPDWSPFVGVNIALGWVILLVAGIIMCSIAGEL